MRTVEVGRLGGPEVLELVERKDPEPGAGQVRVRVRVAGVNFADVLQRRGTYLQATSLPFTPGVEVVGRVDDVGADVAPGATTSVGARVAAMLGGGGGYAESVAVPAAELVPVPDGVPDETVAALLVQGLTAAALVEKSLATTGPRAPVVFVSAAAGGVGALLTQLLVAEGATVVAGVSSAEKAAIAGRLGAAVVARYDRADWADQVRRELSGTGARPAEVDVVLDAVGGDVYRTALSLLGAGGTAVVYGAASGELVGAPPELFATMFARNQTVAAFALPTLIAADPTWAPRVLADLLDRAERGRLDVLVHPAFALDDVVAAHTALEQRRTAGKVVLTVAGDDPTAPAAAAS